MKLLAKQALGKSKVSCLLTENGPRNFLNVTQFYIVKLKNRFMYFSILIVMVYRVKPGFMAFKELAEHFVLGFLPGRQIVAE